MNTLAGDVRSIVGVNQCYSPYCLTLDHLYSYMPVFVYGTTMRAFSDSDVLQGFPRLGRAMTQKKFQMFIVDAEPVVFDPTDVIKMAAHVYGELYIVPPKVVFTLDRLLCNTLHFIRRDETVRYIDDSERNVIHTTAATMYVGNRAQWDRFKKYEKRADLYRSPEWGDDLHYYRFSNRDDRPNLPMVM